MKKLFVLAVALLMPLQAMAYSIEREYDEFTKTEKVYQEGNSPKGSATDFDLWFTKDKDGNVDLSMRIEYTSNSFLYVRALDESVVFLVDGEPMKFIAGRVKRDFSRFRSSSLRYEWFFVFLTRESLEKLCNATELKCRIHGLKYYDEFDGFEKVQKRWKEFIAENADLLDKVY